jgi:uncharacterized protein involved in exopolysaccharide biosynthesis
MIWVQAYTFHAVNPRSAAVIPMPTPEVSYRQALTPMALLALLKAHRRGIIWTAVCLAVLAGAWQLVTPMEYKSAVLVSIASDDRSRLGGGLSSVVSQLGPLASLAGAAGLGMSQKAEPLAVLKSHFLAQQFIVENNIIDIFYTPTALRQRILQFFGLRKKPTLWKATEYFDQKIVRVTQDTKTGLITLSVTWRDPKVAAAWANGLIQMANRQLRDKAIAESQRHIDYLTDQASKTSLVELRTAVSALIENEVKQSMLAKGNDQFALSIIDPAVAPEEPSSPGLFMTLLGGALAGFALSSFSIYVFASARKY